MRLAMSSTQLLPIVKRAFSPDERAPTDDDIITLYLFLPCSLTHTDGRRYEVRSALTSLLTEANEATGRTDDGEVFDESRIGNLLGAVGYLALIDQAGKVIRWTDQPDPDAATGFERLLIQHGITAEDAAALYALRCALVHSYGLSNRPPARTGEARRELLTRTFHLEAIGAGVLVTHPDTPWDGDPNDVGRQETIVSLDRLGHLADELVLHLQETRLTTKKLVFAATQTSVIVRRDYMYNWWLPDS